MAKPYLRDEAVSLRKSGYSYGYIKEKLSVSKSTLSYWLASVPYIPNKETLATIGKSRTASGLAKHKLKADSFNKATIQAKKDIGVVNERDLLMLGLGLYLGEGSKTHDNVRVISANPKILRLAVKWFKKVFKINASNLRVRLHLYPDCDMEESTNYWSKELSIPKSNFQSVQIDTRLNKTTLRHGKLAHGTAHLKVIGNGEKSFGVFLARRINACISEVLGEN